MDDLATARRGPFETGPISSQPGPIEAGERDPRYDNEPPLEDRILLEFMEDLQRPGELGAKSIAARIDELMASAARAPEKCESEKTAGAIGDLCKQAREVAARLEAEREKHNRPLLNAQRSLKARADGLIAPLNDAVAKLRRLVDDWIRAEEARKREEQRKADEEARRLREEQERIARERAEAEGGDPEPAPMAEIIPPRIERPIARGDYGSRVGAQKVWCHQIQSVRQLPDRYLKHPKVIEALDKVIAAEIRQAVGKIEIKGVRIWQDTKARIA